jgi:ATP-dependent Lon protease
VPPPVVNRCEVVVLDRYSVEEKVAIARQYLISRIRSRHQIGEGEIFFDPGQETDLLRHLVRTYTHEAGVRQLERMIRTLFLRIQRKEILASLSASVRVTRETIKTYLEEPSRPRQIADEDRVGEMLALGVDAERGVGSVIPIQATHIRAGPGRKGEWRGPLSMVHATGNIERIMDESRKVATTRIFSCAEKLGIAIEHLQDPVHLHFMGGSTRKDGPSAGGSIALALASLLTGRRVRRDVAMTGEIDTQGRITADTLRVLASGGPDASILLIPPEARPELEERVGRAVRVREVVIRRERLSQVLGDILRSQPPPDFGKPAAVVAPFFLLRQDGILAERLAPESSLGPLRIFANNYTVQSVKIKASKGLLNRVYGHLAHLPREVLETCPFLGLRDGVHVVDLAFIPEKYRLDTQRAEKLLARCLARWLQVVEGVDP